MISMREEYSNSAAATILKLIAADITTMIGKSILVVMIHNSKILQSRFNKNGTQHYANSANGEQQYTTPTKMVLVINSTTSLSKQTG